MSKRNSQSSGDASPAKNEINEGISPDSPEFAQDLEAAGPAHRMSTEIKIGLGTLGFLLVVLVGVVIYRIWQMKASDGGPSPVEKAAAVARKQAEPAEQANDPNDPASSPAASPEPAAASSETGSSPWNVDYSNRTAEPSPATTAPAWPAEVPSAAASANVGSPWAEVDIGQTLLPEPPNDPGTDDRSSIGGGSQEVGSGGDVRFNANSQGVPDIPRGDDAVGQASSPNVSNTAPSDIPFGPWNAAGTSPGEISGASPPAISDVPPAAPIRSATAAGTAPDFFAGGMPITRDDAAAPQELPTAAGAPISGGSFSAPQATPADLSTGEDLAPLGEAGMATATPPFGQGGVPSAPSAAVGGSESPSNANAGLAVAEPARSIGSPSWGGSPAPQVPPLAAGNASGAAAVSGKTYTVQEGETLFDIARRELGRASRWVEIYDLNRVRLGKQMEGFQPGITLILPHAESAATAPSPQVFR